MRSVAFCVTVDFDVRSSVVICKSVHGWPHSYLFLEIRLNILIFILKFSFYINNIVELKLAKIIQTFHFQKIFYNRKKEKKFYFK